ncbi:MAG: class I SAM-dependent methyltransferase [Flavobacterium sp.]|uniref:class I SAM-dependent methyltransferase n=1 Tax=Flavobacterium sp. TaxID=239 RepID=UPI001205AF01|nr:class I SAM-dependent methyltransferase [Flavobacterium sp.]RZJ66938.1 MAG: class I SAM-dependent methyltransferase [Flavobacterium sp.]
MNAEELHHLATQLSHPDGEFGIALAENMNETNIGMTRNSIGNLALENGDSVFELGQGNGAHVSELFENADISYDGFEISETMHEAAIAKNSALKNAHFSLYNGTKIPANDATFQKGFSVNTLYFWPDPISMFAEISRVLKPKGIFCLTFAEKDSMTQLPFTDYVFNLYGSDEVAERISQTDLNLVRTDRQFEEVVSKTGHPIERHFVTMVLQKA